jgi:hypothetical protein
VTSVIEDTLDNTEALDAKAHGGERRFEKSDFLRLAYWSAIAFGLLLWIVISWVGTPRQAGTDVFGYKDAGCNLALGRGFYSVGLPGTDDLQSHLFASNGPAVPFLFGLFALLFGCSGYANTFFELLFATMATFAIAALIEPAINTRWKLICAALLGLVLPSGLVFSQPDRGDMPSFAIFVFACLLARSQRKLLSHFAAPVMAGVCALFFPFGGAICGLTIWAIVMTAADCNISWHDLKERALVTLKLIGGFLLPIAIVVVFYQAVDPTAWLRFVGNGFGTSHGGLGALMRNSYGHLFRHAVFSSGPYSISLVSSSLFVIITICYFTTKQLHHRCELRDAILALVMAICVIFAVALFPKENNYLAWTRSALLVLLAASQAHLAFEARRRQVTTLLLVIIGAAVLPFVGLDALIRIQSKTNYEVAKNEVAKFADALQKARIDKLIAIPSSLYFLYKEKLPQIGDAYYIGAVATPSDIGGIIECTPSGPHSENDAPRGGYLPPLILFAHASIHYVPQLFGHRVTRHEWGWSCDQYLAEPISLPLSRSRPGASW